MHRRILKLMDDPSVKDWEPLKQSMLNYFEKNPQPKGVVYEKAIEFNKRIEQEINVSLEFEMYKNQDYTTSAINMKDFNFVNNKIRFIQALRRCPSIYADQLVCQKIYETISTGTIEYKDHFLFPVLKHCLLSLKNGEKHDG